MVENNESMDAPKSVLFHWKYNNYEKDTISSNPWTLQNVSISLGNMKILKISRSKQKSTTPKMLIITGVFEEKLMLALQILEKQTDYSIYSGKLVKQIKGVTVCAILKIDVVDFLLCQVQIQLI